MPSIKPRSYTMLNMCSFADVIQSEGSYLEVLKIPAVVIILVSTVASYDTNGMIDVGLSIHLKKSIVSMRLTLAR